jgi:hypothetical protein
MRLSDGCETRHAAAATRVIFQELPVGAILLGPGGLVLSLFDTTGLRPPTCAHWPQLCEALSTTSTRTDD